MHTPRLNLQGPYLSLPPSFPVTGSLLVLAVPLAHQARPRLPAFALAVPSAWNSLPLGRHTLVSFLHLDFSSNAFPSWKTSLTSVSKAISPVIPGILYKIILMIVFHSSYHTICSCSFLHLLSSLLF